MKTISRVTPLALLLGAGSLLSACEKDLDTYYNDPNAAGFAALGTNVTAVTKYAPGETIPIDVNYNQADQVQDIQVFHVINRQDSAVVTTVQPTNTFNASAGLQTQRINYVVPPALANKTPVRVDVTVRFADGSTKLRRFTYNVANAPTIKFGTTPATYRNGLASTAQAVGDLIGYALILNEGGISTLPPPAATPNAPLFKAIDSLTYFAQVGTAAPVRIGTVRNPTAGQANPRTVDVRVPAGSLGQPVTYTFTAYAQQLTASITAPAITVVAPTALATTRTGRVTFGTASSPDSLAFNLRTGQNEPASGPAANKDLYFTGVAGSAVNLGTANATRFYKVPAATVGNGYYTTATANSVGNLLYQNTNVADLAAVAVNDVYAVRLRGTGEVMLVRIISVQPSSNGSTARVTFTYRSL